jgi:hypothetical protein
VNHGLLWAAVTNCDQHQNVFRRGLGVFDKDVEISVFIESIGVDQLKFCIVLAPPAILFRQPGVRKHPLRILVEHLQVRMRRGSVQVVVDLLDVLAVIALAVGQPEQTFFQNRITAVPES